MPVMAEGGIFTTANQVTQNTSFIHTDDVENCGGKDSCKQTSVIGENNNVTADKLDGNFGDKTTSGPPQENRECNSCTKESLPSQSRQEPEMHQTSLKDSVENPGSLSNDIDFRKEWVVNANNLECNTQIPPNASGNCSGKPQFAEQKEIAKVTLPNAITASPLSNKQETESVPITASLTDSSIISPYFTRSKSKPQEALTSQIRTSLSVVAGSPTTSGLVTSLKPSTTFGSLHCNNDPTPTVSTPAAQDASQMAGITSTISVPVSGIVAPPLTAPLVNSIIKKDEPTCTSSIPPCAVIPQSLTQTLVALSTGVSSSTTTLVQSNTIAENPNLVHKTEEMQSTLSSETVSSVSSVLSLPAPNSSVVLTTTPVAPESFVPGAPVTANSGRIQTAVNSCTENTDSTSETVSTVSSVLSLPYPSSSVVLTTTPVAQESVVPGAPVTANAGSTQRASNSCTENTDSASVLNSSAPLLDIPTIFSDFTPCSKCNSILVCSCPGPSSIGGGSDSVPTTCQASCQGVCTCDKMEVDQKDDLKPPEQDVKPQVFPVVVSFEIRRSSTALVKLLCS